MRFRVSVIMAVAVLGLLAAVVGIERYARTTFEQRHGRAKDAVVAEIDRVADVHTRSPERDVRDIGKRNFQAIKSGVLGKDLTDDSPDPLGPLVAEARAAAASESRARKGAVVRELENHSGVPVVVGARALSDGTCAWAATIVTVDNDAFGLRPLVLVLGLLSLVVLVLSVRILREFELGGRSIRDSLRALADDLNAPVARPRLTELADVSDGIASLARSLERTLEAKMSLAKRVTEMERAAALGRMAAGVAHEVRNPLAAIKLKADLALETTPSDSQLGRDLNDISNEVARLDRFVRDLLLVSKEREASRAALDVGALVGRRVDLLRAWAEGRGVSIETEGEASGAVEEDALVRAVDNLLRNAVEASPIGGRVLACVRRERDAVRIDIANAGAPVPDEVRARLFEPFFSTKSGGTGLGLALVMSVATAHRGTILYRREGDTSHFVLSIPDL